MNMDQIAIKSPEELIVDHLQRNGQKYTWLAGKVGVTVGHLQLVLKGKGNDKKVLTPENRQKINDALGTNY